jgi:hypothetical protein
MRDDDSDDTPVVLLRLPPERELPRCRSAYTIGVTTGPESEAYYCDNCYVAEHSRAPMPRGNPN